MEKEMDKEYIYGLIMTNMKANGLMIRCMDKVKLLIVMDLKK